VKEILTECIRLFEICTVKGPLALTAELDKLSIKAETTASNETKEDGAEGTFSAAIQAASSSLESDLKSTSDNSCIEVTSEARSLSKDQNDISVAILSEEKSPESAKSQEASTANPPSLRFKDVRK
jgi:hypothetical protein